MFYSKQTRAKKALILASIIACLVLAACNPPRGWPGGASEGETLFVGTMEGRVLAVNAGGGMLWAWEPPAETGGSVIACGGGGQFSAGMFYGSPVVADGVVYVASYNGRVYAIDAEKRFDRWKYDTGSPIAGGAVVANNTVFVGSSDGKLYALDANATMGKGSLKKGFEPFQTGDKIWATPAVQDGTVYFGSLDQKLYAVDAVTGELKWEFKAGGAISSTPLIVDSVVYIGAFDGKFYALDADTGGEKWVFDGADNWFWSTAVYANGTVYACSLDHRVYAIDAASGEPASGWAEPFDVGDDIKSSPVIADDVLVVATEEGKVFGLDMETGKSRWPDAIDLEVKVLSPLFASGDTVYVNAQDNRLYAFEGATGRQNWSIPLGE